MVLFLEGGRREVSLGVRFACLDVESGIYDDRVFGR